MWTQPRGNLHVHVVSVTTYRRGVFHEAMPTRCDQVIRQVREDFGAELRELPGETDHVHLLVGYPPTFALSRVVNSLKRLASHRLRLGYSARSTGDAPQGMCGARPPSPRAAAEHHQRSSRSTSVGRNDPTRQALPPRPEGPGFRAQILR
ncbi:MAG TPA: IS200/IS605 family transposase [Kineosporiaceae bacterium]|nr:IS200/IS605 family transposase [Kineosporiaceae bacterium]